ncbi:uracil-DNA glycosylase [Aquirufa ecclesiirivi]|uniref:uracil-DNA glycosylase n=1 Tax=Aquirufa ecclesiirivi TaxID=2715124 RepID=UPI003BB04882
MDQIESKIVRKLPDLLMNDWKNIFLSELGESYFESIQEKLDEKMQTEELFPPRETIFQAFNLCSFADTQVVIIGQDPYHGKGQAHGLCFSVPQGMSIPPSLRNIKRELHLDLDAFLSNEDGDLSPWAKQGVLLLNSILTVSEAKPGSHEDLGWQQLTSLAIEKISEEKEHVVFLLWGNFAQKLAKNVDSQKHLLLYSSHPSPLSANRGGWFGNKVFSKTNDYLIAHRKKAINWL